MVNLAASFKDDARGPCRRRAQHRRGGARAGGATALVHISAIGADAEVEADYGRTKGEGEQAVRDAFPDATIIRPSLVFGPEDQLTNRLAALARLPVAAGDRRPAPVPAGLCSRPGARRSRTAALDPQAHGGKTYEIGGPQVLTMRELHRRDPRSRRAASPSWSTCPISSARLLSRFGFLPGAPLTRDQWLMLQRDNVAGQGRAGPRGVRDPADAARRGRSGMARPIRTAATASRGRRVNLTATTARRRCRSSSSSSSSASSRASPNICRSPRPAI